MLKRTLLTSISLLLAFSIAGAEMYQWVDEKGVVTFKDTPPPSSKKRQKVKTYRDGDFTPATAYQPAPRTGIKSSTPLQPSTPVKKRFAGTVEIYVTDWCGFCKKAEKYLKSNGIPYVAYDIEKDKGAGQRHRELGGRGVPLIIVGSNKMSGFNPETLEYYLNNSK